MADHHQNLMGFLRKHIQITMRNIKEIGATSFELSCYKKLTTYTQTHRHTYLIFDTNSRLDSKIKKAKVISRFRNILEGFIKTQIEFLDVNFHISNTVVYISDVELRCVVLK